MNLQTDRTIARAKAHATIIVVAFLAGCGGEEYPAGRAANMFNANDLRKALEEGAGGEAVADAAPASLGEPTGWATISGVFILRGAAPPRAPLTASRDQDVCTGGGHQLLDE